MVANQCQENVVKNQSMNQNIAMKVLHHAPNCWQISDPNVTTMQPMILHFHLNQIEW